MSRAPKVPSYRLHKSTGQAVVTIQGKDFYLGRHGSPESRAEYARLISLWTAGGGSLPPEPSPDLTVSEVLAAYWRFAQTYYRQPDLDTGELTGTQQLHRVRQSLGPVRDLYGATEARKFGPLALQAVRSAMVSRGLARKTVNGMVDCVRRCFRWAASNELIPASVFHGLQSVEGLKAGRCEAPDHEPVLPVPEADIEPVKAVVLPVVADLIDLQLLTAARPGELLTLRPAELDRSGDVWLYRPRSHKTAHRGHERVILFGPRAQAVVARYLLRPAETYCFSPREAMQTLLASLGRSTRTGAGDRYQVSSYVRAIRRGCDLAGVPRFRPHRLRHNAATRLVEQFGWDMARIILGHRTLSATRIYGENDMAKALEVVRHVG